MSDRQKKKIQSTPQKEKMNIFHGTGYVTFHTQCHRQISPKLFQFVNIQRMGKTLMDYITRTLMGYSCIAVRGSVTSSRTKLMSSTRFNSLADLTIKLSRTIQPNHSNRHYILTLGK